MSQTKILLSDLQLYHSRLNSIIFCYTYSKLAYSYIVEALWEFIHYSTVAHRMLWVAILFRETMQGITLCYMMMNLEAPTLQTHFQLTRNFFFFSLIFRNTHTSKKNFGKKIGFWHELSWTQYLILKICSWNLGTFGRSVCSILWV